MTHDDLGSVHQAVARLNAGDVAGFTQLLTREFFTHRPAEGEPTAPEVIAQLLTAVRGALPDLAVRLSEPEAVDGGTRVVVTLTGTQSGPLWGVPPLGRERELPIPVVVRIVDGKFAFTLDLAPPAGAGLVRELELINPADQMHLPPKHPVQIPDVVLRLAFTGQMADKPCPHIADVAVTQTTIRECRECVTKGDIWPGLRMCMVCGYVGCCDTSVNTHMKRHWESTGHAIMRSIRLDEAWVWCYVCNAFRDSRWLHALEAERGAT